VAAAATVADDKVAKFIRAHAQAAGESKLADKSSDALLVEGSGGVIEKPPR
jgi:hypothetical protein